MAKLMSHLRLWVQKLYLLVRAGTTAHRQATEQLLTYHTQLQALVSELALAEEQERRRIATGLHDDIGQCLAVAQITIGEYLASEPVEARRQTLDQLRGLLEHVIRTTRALTFELSSPVLYELGLEAALQSLGEWMAAQHSIGIRVDADHPPLPLAAEARTLLFRVSRELLVNAVKHAQAHHVHVSLGKVGAHVRLIVQDDGRGFDPTEAGTRISPTGGFGLFSVRENITRMAGCLQIVSAPGAGTEVTVSVPLACRIRPSYYGPEQEDSR